MMSPTFHEPEALAEWHERQLLTFAKIAPKLESASEELREVLRRIADEVAPDAAVHVRVKSLLSVSEKILRGDNPRLHPEPFDLQRGLPDLIGGQIVTYTRRDRDAVCRLVEQLGKEHREGAPGGSMEIDDEASVDTATRLLPDQFGYSAHHYIIRLHGSEMLGVRIDAASACKRKMEIQITPVLAHAWGVVTHDRTYKSVLILPDRLRRRVAEAKAMLDAAERQLEEAIVDLDRHRRKHAGRLWAAAAGDDDEAFVRATLVCDGVLRVAQNAETRRHEKSVDNALELRAELAMAQGDWGKAIECLDEAVRHRGHLAARLAEAHQHAGQSGTAKALLDGLLERDPTHRVAACARAELCIAGDSPSQGDYDLAAQVLERAFLAEASDPELLMAYTTARLLRDRDAARLCTMRGVLQEAIEECRKREELGVEVPECLFLHARLALFADDLFEAVNTYCLAALHGSVRERIEQERHHIRLLRSRVKPNPQEPRVVSLRVGLECAEMLLDLLGRKFVSAEGGSGGKVDSDVAARFERRPVVIIAGGCDAMSEQHREKAEAMFDEALKGFHGTVICGGTTSGVGGIVGRAAKAARDSGEGGHRFRAIGYLPERELVRESGDRVDDRYDEHVFVTPMEPGPPAYSPHGPIRTWIDLFDAGVQAEDVRVVGVNGGRLSGFEFRLGVALGAKVGLIEDSGRAVATLLTDRRWRNQPGVTRLLTDPDTVRFFMDPGSARSVHDSSLDAASIEALGKVLHENYRAEQLRKAEYVHPSAMPWEKLDPVYRSSSLQQASTLSGILAAGGFEIVPDSDPRKSVELGVPDQDDPTRTVCNPKYRSQLNRMARLEHARWNAERLVSGWSYGPKRDLEAKTSPYLVPFDALPDDIKRYDYEPFLNLQRYFDAIYSPGATRFKIVRSTAAEKS